MNLPFTHDQFLDTFAAYNRLLWPAAAMLWVGTLGVLVAWGLRGSAASPALAAMLALHWAWSAAAYHLAFFRAINPAAGAFAVLFLVQAGLLAWKGIVHRDLSFIPARSGWGAPALVLVAYALAYPVIGVLAGLSYPETPTFGVPCPTTILTAGLLLAAPRGQARPVAWITLLWSLVGGSAAFTLGIRPDLVLPVAGAVLLLHVLLPTRAAKPAS